MFLGDFTIYMGNSFQNQNICAPIGFDENIDFYVELKGIIRKIALK